MITLFVNNDILYHELSDTVRLFFGTEEIKKMEMPEQGRAINIFVFNSGDDWMIDTDVFGYKHTYNHKRVDESDEILYKRMLRRAAKLALYYAFKLTLIVSPSWGALTGIRPTKLLRQLITETGDLGSAIEVLSGEMDVSARKVNLLVEIIDTQRGIYQHGNDDATDIYIGIPYCTTKCLYCSFASTDLSKCKIDNRDEYTDAIIREIEQGGSALISGDRYVRSIYVGGGTPTALGRSNLERILTATNNTFGSSRELTVEAGRPDTIDADMLKMLKDNGVDRTCVNAQSMNDKTLEVIGRAHSSKAVLDTIALVKKYDFNSINTDIIAGLPGETLTDFENTLHSLENTGIDNLTVHTLAIKRASRLKEKLSEYALPNAEEVEKMVTSGYHFAASLMMNPYYMYRQKYMTGNLENVGYAVKGKECIYNIDIMEETHNIGAFGAGGISKRMFFDKNLHTRSANPKNIEIYIQRIDELVERKIDYFI